MMETQRGNSQKGKLSLAMKRAASPFWLFEFEGTGNQQLSIGQLSQR